MKYLLLVIVLVTSTFSTIYAQSDIDSVKVAISDIRKANLVFVDYDAAARELNYCKKINTISASQLVVSDSIINNLEKKVTNLEIIVTTKDRIHDVDVNLIKKRFDRFKKNTFISGGSVIGVVLLIILL